MTDTTSTYEPIAVRWPDPLEINADEAHVRVDQEMFLPDVLRAYDLLSAAFMPSTDRRITLDGQTAALVALESGLYGHLRAARAAVLDGRVQDVAAAHRTLEEIRKKAVLAASDPELAARLSTNEEFKSQAIDDMYEKHMKGLGAARSDEQRDRDKDLFGRQSWILHARHAGLQFLASTGPDGTIVTRGPAAQLHRDRGRGIALHALAIAGQAVGVLVPPLLTAHGIAHDDGTRRYGEFAHALDDLVVPYRAQAKLRKDEPAAKIEVDAIGQLFFEDKPVRIELTDLAEDEEVDARGEG